MPNITMGMQANPTQPLDEMINSAMQKVTDWYDKDQTAKQPYTKEMKEADKLYIGDHWSVLDNMGRELRSTEAQADNPCNVENSVFTMVYGTVSEFAQDIELIDYPQSDDDKDTATMFTELKKFLFYKNRAMRGRIDFLMDFELYGTGIWHTVWDPDWKGGKGPNRWNGDVRMIALSPEAFFPDARCVTDINEGNRCHKRVWHTLESIKEKYPERGGLVTEQSNLNDMVAFTEDVLLEENMVQASASDQCPVIETWYKGEPLILGKGEKNLGPGLHVIWWAGEDQRVYLRHSNYIYFEPGETAAFPFHLAQNYRRKNSVWGIGTATILKNPQIIKNKVAELITLGHAYSAVGQTFYEAGSLTPKQARTIEERGTVPGEYIEVTSIGSIKREYGRPVANSLFSESTRIDRVIENLVGRYDVSMGRTPGDVTAFKAIAELSQRAKVRLQIKEMMITAAYEEAGTYMNRLIWEYYTEVRKFRILGEGGMQTRTFDRDNHLKAYNHETGQVIPYKAHAIMQALSREAPEGDGTNNDAIEIYAPEFDTICKTTQTQPSDKMYNMEIAKELVMKNLIDRESFFYVMKHGRFEEWDQILQRLVQQEEEAKQAQMQQMQQQNPQQMMGTIQEEQMPAQDMQAEEEMSSEEQFLEGLISQLPPEEQEYIRQLPLQEQARKLLAYQQQGGEEPAQIY